MKGLLILLILALLVIALDRGELHLPARPQFLVVERSSARRPPVASYRSLAQWPHQRYRTTSYRSSRSWDTSPAARYLEFRARLSDSGVLLERSAENVVIGVRNHNWGQIMRGKANAEAARRTFTEATAMLRAR